MTTIKISYDMPLRCLPCGGESVEVIDPLKESTTHTGIISCKVKCKKCGAVGELELRKCVHPRMVGERRGVA